MRRLLVIVVVSSLFVGLAVAQNANAQCDRQCLEGFVNQYLAAMVAHDASKAPFAPKAKYTENAKVLAFPKPSEGLWSTKRRKYCRRVKEPD